MSKYTQGPWTLTFLGKEDDGEAGLKTKVGSSILYAKFISKADAQLISAAPDLLEALEAFERISDIWLPAEVEEQHGEELYALHMARNKMLAAIAKANGEKQ